MESETTWPEKVDALHTLPNVTYVQNFSSFTSPPAGNFFVLNDRRFLVTKSREVDGVVLAVAPSRSHCAIVVEGPADSAVAVVAQSPAILDCLVPSVFRILGSSYVPVVHVK